tara:strand:- start:948 stop:1910 length:963 start_codon:yes stop_codon:yes gene_type:complete
MLKLKFINWWSNGNDDFFKKFIENYMNIKTEIVDNNPDILFFSVFNKISPHQYVKNNPNIKIKIFFTGEDTTSRSSRGCGSDHYYLNFADISLGFKNIIHPNYIRFPLWITYINIEKFNMGKTCLPFNKLDNFKSNGYNDTLFCSIVSNHDSNNTRTKIIESLSKYKKINVGGGIANLLKKNNIPIIVKGAGKSINDKQNYLKKFKFNICSESSISDGYITEKLFECIIGGCIPIYYCDDNVMIEPEILNNDFIIKYNNNNIDSAVHKIKELDTNKEIYNKFIAQKPLNDNAYSEIIKCYDLLKSKLLQLFESKKLIYHN